MTSSTVLPGVIGSTIIVAIPQKNNPELDLEAEINTLLSNVVQEMPVGHPSAPIRHSPTAGHPLPLPPLISSVSSEQLEADSELQDVGSMDTSHEEHHGRIATDSDSSARTRESASLPPTTAPFAGGSQTLVDGE